MESPIVDSVDSDSQQVLKHFYLMVDKSPVSVSELLNLDLTVCYYPQRKRRPYIMGIEFWDKLERSFRKLSFFKNISQLKN